jgi:hypothetical protein
MKIDPASDPQNFFGRKTKNDGNQVAMHHLTQRRILMKSITSIFKETLA